MNHRRSLKKKKSLKAPSSIPFQMAFAYQLCNHAWDDLSYPNGMMLRLVAQTCAPSTLGGWSRMTKFIAWTILQISVSKNGVRVRVCNTQLPTRFSYKCKYFLLVFNIFTHYLFHPYLKCNKLNKICYRWLSSLSYWNKNCQLDLTAYTAAPVIFTEYSLKFLI